MLLLMLLFFFLLGLGVCQLAFRIENGCWGLGLPLPVGLTLAIGTCKTLDIWLPLDTAWHLTLGVFTVLIAVMGWQLKKRGVHWSWPSLTKFQLSLIGVAFALTYFYLHTRQILEPENDFLTHFPLISLMANGVFPPPNPYYPDVEMHGHFGRDYLIALLSRSIGGDSIFTVWVFNHVLHLSCFLLCVGLGYAAGSSIASVLVPYLAFGGVSVGSRVGLMDTVDNNNLLVYCVLLTLLSLVVHCAGRPPRFSAFFMLSVLLGVYAIIYETHMVLMLGILCLTPLLYFWSHSELQSFKTSLKTTGLCFLCCLASLMLGAILGGPIQDLALRSIGYNKVRIQRFESYESQKVSIKFPKKRLFQVCLGTEAYNRISYVYQSKAFHGIPPRLDQGGYTYVYQPKFLVLHWLALYLAVPCGLYLFAKRNFVGTVCWTFGLSAFLAPALVDFGPVHELEYFRWQFAAGFGFALALGLALGQFAEKRGVGTRILVALLTALTCYGGIRLVNQTVIAIQRESGVLSQRVWNPLYPGGFQWITELPELGVDLDDVAVTLRVRESLGERDRLLTGLFPRSNVELLSEASLMGLIGARAVGHQSPPPWLPVGAYPYFRDANWSVFWSHYDPRALAGLQADWIYLHSAQKKAVLEAMPELILVAESGDKSAFSVRPETFNQPPPSGLEIVAWEMPDHLSYQSEVAYPLKATFANRSERSVRWRGLFVLNLLALEGLESHPRPLKLRVDLDIPAGGTQLIDLWLVPPLIEGNYLLEPFLEGGGEPTLVPSPPVNLRYSFTKEAAVVSLSKLEELSRVGEELSLALHLKVVEPGFKVAGPVYLGWRIWDAAERRYGTPFGYDGLTPLQLEEQPGEYSREITLKCPTDTERYVPHFFLVSLSRLEVPLAQLPPVGGSKVP